MKTVTCSIFLDSLVIKNSAGSTMFIHDIHSIGLLRRSFLEHHVSNSGILSLKLETAKAKIKRYEKEITDETKRYDIYTARDYYGSDDYGRDEAFDRISSYRRNLEYNRMYGHVLSKLKSKKVLQENKANILNDLLEFGFILK
jgi:hypothetical protein